MDHDSSRVVSAKDHDWLKRLMDDYRAGRLGPGPDNTRRRRPGGGGGGEAKKYATIVRSLQRPDPTTDPATEAISSYRVKLASEAAHDVWIATHGLYEAEDKVLWTDGMDYECSTAHTASEGKEPDNESYWTLISLEAFVLGYPYTDLIGTVPWFEVGAEVEVVQRSGVWYIHETASRCEEVGDDGELFTSVQWNDDDKRVMAVYR